MQAIQPAEKPWIGHFLDWIDERFAWKNGILFVTLYVTVATLTRAATGSDGIAYSLFDLWGAVLTWSFFLLIRIFDEHKDYEKDCLNHPHRVLQSGRITLGQLRAVGAVAIAAQLGTSLWLDGGFGPVTLAWLALFGWLCLMGKEFFCGVWLEKRLTLYAVSHMAIMPFIVYWLAQLAVPGSGWNTATYGLSALALVSGFAFEITRKTWGPEEERETIDSYARIFGIPRAIRIIQSLTAVMVAIQGLLTWQLAGQTLAAAIALALLAIVGAWALLTLNRFLAAPSAEGRERNEAAVGITTLAGYLILTLAVLTAHGLA